MEGRQFNKKLITAPAETGNTDVFSSNLKKMKITIGIVDDESEVREQLSNTIYPLSAELSHLVGDVEIITFINGVDALVKNRQYPLDLVITDIRMGVMDGFKYCSKVRELIPEMEKAPFVFVSNDVGETEKELEAYKLGAVRAFDKSFINAQDAEKEKVFYDYILNLCIKILKEKSEKFNSKLFEDAVYRYVNKGLIANIMEQGFIDDGAHEAEVGIVFGDICNSSELEEKLTPLETKTLLNGYYTLIYEQIELHQGYLIKTMGDGFMMSFGGPLDKNISKENTKQDIADKILKFCVSCQRMLNDFNSFKYISVNPDNQQEINRAYEVLGSYQINNREAIDITMRLGACQGDMVVGDFGPKDLRQYDVVSRLVNLAARLQTKAVERGICLDQSVVDNLSPRAIPEYITDFRQKAHEYYKDVENDDVFSFSLISVKGFSEEIPVYALEPLYNLPEIIQGQIENALAVGFKKGSGTQEKMIQQIITVILGYAGNKFVLKAIDDLFVQERIKLRRRLVFRIMNPEQYEKIKDVPEQLEGLNKLSLYELLEPFRVIKKSAAAPVKISRENDAPPAQIGSYEALIYDELMGIKKSYAEIKKIKEQEVRFENFILPQVLVHLKASFKEYFLNKERKEGKGYVE